jgi:hypothetical protein
MQQHGKLLQNMINQIAYQSPRSVISRSLQATAWPTILQSDAAATRHVRGCVVVLSWLSFLGILIGTIAGFATPLGLTDAFKRQDPSTSVLLKYAPDGTNFGSGTPPRPNQPFSRTCGMQNTMPCQGQPYWSKSQRDEFIIYEHSELQSSGKRLIGSNR